MDYSSPFHKAVSLTHTGSLFGDYELLLARCKTNLGRFSESDSIVELLQNLSDIKLALVAYSVSESPLRPVRRHLHRRTRG
jgi:hypothetical protein